MKAMFDFINVLSIFFEAIIIKNFLSTISKTYVLKKKFVFMVYIVYIIILSLIFIFISNAWIKLSCVFISILLISLIYDIDRKKRIFGTIILFIIMNLSELLIGFIMSAIFYMTVNEIRDSILYYSVGMLASKSITLLFVKIFKYKYKPQELQISMNLIFLFSLFPLSTFGVGVILIGGFGTNVNPFFSISGIIAMITLFVANLLVFYLFEHDGRQQNIKNNLEIEKVQLKTETEYLKEIIEKQTLSAKEMHDLKNELFAIRELLSTNSQEGIEKINEVCEIVVAMQSIVYTGDVSVDALINSKVYNFKKEEIVFKCECFISGFGSIKQIDLCVLLGNMLDNAIEACSKVEKNKTISLSFLQKGNYIGIQVKNSFNAILNVEKEEIVTTKINKESHGFGLKSIKLISEKYQGSFEVEKEDNIFIASVLLCTDGCI